jgi:hypothetical protein
MQDLVGKEVQIYPGDTYKKWGIVLEVNDNGILFEITKADDNALSYQKGSIRFISYSANLNIAYYK